MQIGGSQKWLALIGSSSVYQKNGSTGDATYAGRQLYVQALQIGEGTPLRVLFIYSYIDASGDEGCLILVTMYG